MITGIYHVQVYRDAYKQCNYETYLTHPCQKAVRCLKFCPYEDVLGAGHGEGFTSLIVPGKI